MFDPETKQQIRESCRLVRDEGARAATIFEARLLAVDSEGGRLLQGETRNDGFLVSLLSLLDGPLEGEALIRKARALGREYAASGVTPDQYATAGTALLQMVQTLLGAAFTSDLEDCWIQAYSALSNEMELHGGSRD